jgi:hypothetical protein
MEQHRIKLGMLAVILVCLVVFCCVAHLYAWFIFVKHFVFSDGECDQPLGTWLGTYLYLVFVAKPSVNCCVSACGRRRGQAELQSMTLEELHRATIDDMQRINRRQVLAHRLHGILSVSVLFWGIISVQLSDTCQETNARLYEFVSFFAWLVLLVPIFLLVITCTTTGILIYLSTLARSPKAASKDTFDIIPNVKLGPNGAPEDTVANQDASDNICCICMLPFGGDRPGRFKAMIRKPSYPAVKKTPCGHMMHAECLQPWLNVARTCPICRTDLDEACRGAGAGSRR